MTASGCGCAGRGHAGEPARPRGDLYVGVAVRRRPPLPARRQRPRVGARPPLHPGRAGRDHDVETLEGRSRSRCGRAPSPARCWCCAARASRVLGGRGRGDHRVVVNVLVPRKLTDDQRGLLDEFEADGRRGHLRGRRRLLRPAARRIPVKRYSLRVPAAEAEPALARMLDLFPDGVRAGGATATTSCSPATPSTRPPRVSRRPSRAAAGRTPGASTTGRSGAASSGSARRGPPPGRAPAVVIDPGPAFGTGAHGSTRAALELLQRLEPQPALDLGCGSGVLSIAALRLGFGPLRGFDLDPLAVGAAAENAARNGVGARSRGPTCCPIRCPTRRSGWRTSSSTCCSGCCAAPTCRRCFSPRAARPQTVGGAERRGRRRLGGRAGGP